MYLQQLKAEMQRSKVGRERGTFYVKNGIKKGKGLELRAEPSRVNLLEYCPSPPRFQNRQVHRGIS